MPAQVLAPGVTAAVSSDIVVTTPNKTIAMYRSIDDYIMLEDNSGPLLQESGDELLLETQGGDSMPYNDHLEIMIKDPNGAYNSTGMWLRSTEPFKELGPGTWQVRRPVVSIPIGVQVD